MNRGATCLISVIAFGGACAAQPAAPRGGDVEPRNVIVFIADGGGYNAHLATRMWLGQSPKWESREWFTASCATYALRGGQRQGRMPDLLSQDPGLVYDPAKAWDATPQQGEAGGYPLCFQGYRWLRATAPDSANTATAIFTGERTYPGAINVDGALQPLRSVAEVAKAAGKAVGVVTSVPFSHATPACGGGAHNPTREDYHGIAAEMLRAGVCDFIAGAGHPEFDHNGGARAAVYEWIAETEWKALRAGTLIDDAGRAWKLVDDTAEIGRLADSPEAGPVIAVARVAATLQEKRRAKGDAHLASPGDDPFTPNLPTLSQFAMGALAAVGRDPDGFFMMVEGGAVDWAMHDNECGRMIEEMTEFYRAIEDVSARLDEGDRTPDPNDPSWGNTLVIITADHDHLLWGPACDTLAFQPLEDRGAGKVPGHRWMSNGHSNQPVPLWARGAGSERFREIATQDDSGMIAGRRVERPANFHQQEIGRLILTFLGPAIDRASAEPVRAER